ncbi:MAG: dUTP diphosphatase [Aminivibrio sp.]|jgi:dUTP pyrophosphatase
MVDEILIIASPEHIPERKHPEDAGADLKAARDAIICPGKTEMVGTGVRALIPYHYAGFVFARSGLASRHGIRPANCVGVVDHQYRGEIMVPVYNDGAVPYEIKKGDRIAQLVVLYVELPNFMPVDRLPESDRGAGGFGSTGI